MQPPQEALSCVSSLQLTYPLCEGYQDIGELNPSLCAGPPSSCGSTGDLPPHQDHPHINPPWDVQLVICKSLALAGKGCVPKTGLRIWCEIKVETFIQLSFLACSLPSSLLSFLLCLFAFIFFSPLDVQLPDSNSPSLASSQYLCGFPSIKLRTTFCLMFSVGSARGRSKCHKVRRNDFLGHGEGIALCKFK